MDKLRLVFCLAGLIIMSSNLYGQSSTDGSITGKLVVKATKKPLEFGNVALYKLPDSTFVGGTMTDAEGKFYLNHISNGKYYLVCGRIGFEQINSTSMIIDSLHTKRDIGKIQLIETALPTDSIVVTADKPALKMSIDRVVYDATKDLVSESGSVSELLQHVPSVSVDMDGNVSLKGSEDVLILINGRSSPLMGKTRADVLQQMPANSIEKIEVIENPSAKYKPEGTAGIINLVLKKNTGLGLNGSVTTSGGWDSRFTGRTMVNYNPGHFNLFGNYSFRRDYAIRNISDTRNTLGPDSLTSTSYNQIGAGHYRPTSHMAGLGADYTPDQSNRMGISGNYFFRDNPRTNDMRNTLIDNSIITSDYIRSLNGKESEYENEGTAYYDHTFVKEDHTLHVEYNISGQPEKEDSRYTNTYYVITPDPLFDNTFFKQTELQHQFSLEYSNPINDKTKLEAGFSYEQNKQDIDNRAENYDTLARSFFIDTTKTNRFVFREKIAAVYTTFMRSFGKIGAMAGLRYEYAQNNSHLVTGDSNIKNDYSEFYPSLHLSYSINDMTQLQLSYSRRTNRPDGEDLNPFPVYQDPLNVETGNPRLLPEFVHSIQLGCQIMKGQLTVTPSIFYMDEYNSFTWVTQPYQNSDSILVTTMRNLSSNQSGGIGAVIGGSVGNYLDIDFTLNGFRSTIDASNIGYGKKKSVNSATGFLDINWKIRPTTMLQSSTNGWSSRLTPQGKHLGSFVSNLGLRQNFYDNKLSVTMTVSDIFKSRTFKTHLRTDWLTSDSKMSRNSRVIYLGATYRFGNAVKRHDAKLDYEQ